MSAKEEKVFTDLISVIMDCIGLIEQEFMHTLQLYMINPQTQKILQKVQMGGADANTKT